VISPVEGKLVFNFSVFLWALGGALIVSIASGSIMPLAAVGLAYAAAAFVFAERPPDLVVKVC
jgi:hypothetical protein